MKLTLVRGNHDAHAGDPPVDLNITVLDEPYELDGFSFCHHPHERGYVVAGHLHPAYRLTTADDSVGLPCFVFGEASSVLPSFGAFTVALQLIRNKVNACLLQPRTPHLKYPVTRQFLTHVSNYLQNSSAIKSLHSCLNRGSSFTMKW